MTAVAREQGIITETDAAEEERLLAVQPIEDWGHLLNSTTAHGTSAQPEACRQTSDCAPHGVCSGGICECAAAFSGRYCGHSVLLSAPFIANSSGSSFAVGYEGSFAEPYAEPYADSGDSGAAAEERLLGENLLKVSYYAIPVTGAQATESDWSVCCVAGPGDGQLCSGGAQQ